MASPQRTEASLASPRVGIAGAGQLARMLCEAASSLGIRTVVLAERDDEGACEVAGEVLLGSPRSAADLERLSDACDVVTFDHELVDLEAVAALAARGRALLPGASSLLVAVDKAEQRRGLAAAGIAVPEFEILGGTLDEDLERLGSLTERFGEVPVLKAARGGYDGRGVLVHAELDAARAATATWRAAGTRVVAERRVAFRRELAALVVRRSGGELAAWRTVETDQVDGMCRELRVPGSVADELSERGAALARQIAELFDVVGVLAVELFDTEGGLLVNEVAMRPHNSGHWTIEGAVTSQFENHLRAVLDLPLGDTSLAAASVATVNVVGGALPWADGALAAALSEPDAKVHLYGKGYREGRKLGHVTVMGTDPDDAYERAWRAAAALGTPRPTTREAPR